MFKIGSTLLAEFSPARLTVRNLDSGITISEVPELAIDANGKKVLAAGEQARQAAAAVKGARLTNPFAHPRSLLSDFTSAETLLRIFVKRAAPRQWLTGAPRLYMHPLVDPEGGFTQIELRALRELALGAGAWKVALCIGGLPTDEEMLQGKPSPFIVEG